MSSTATVPSNKSTQSGGVTPPVFQTQASATSALLKKNATAILSQVLRRRNA